MASAMSQSCDIRWHWHHGVGQKRERGQEERNHEEHLEEADNVEAQHEVVDDQQPRDPRRERKFLTMSSPKFLLGTITSVR